MKDYPDTANCICGSKSYLDYRNIITKYSGKEIEVKNVPVYKCLSVPETHIKLARRTRVRLKDLLKYSYDNDKNIILYSETTGL